MNEDQTLSALVGWTRANHMLRLFEYYRDQRINDQGERVPDITMIQDNDGICLFLWQACLYSVMEFLYDRKFLPNNLIEQFEPIRYQLKEFRNCVFHIQDVFLDPRQDKLFAVEDGIAITRHIHEEVGSFLESKLKEFKDRG